MSQNTEEFLSVIENNKGIIYKVANFHCKDEEDRKDLVQEIIIQLWKSFDNYNNQYKYSTWIYRIALNVAISFYRKEKRRKEISNPLTESIFTVIDSGEDTDKETNYILLRQYVSELKELDKAVMLLFLEEKSHKEISAIIGITETNVSTKIGRIKKILKKRFSNIKQD